MSGFSTIGKVIGITILLVLCGYVVYFVWIWATDPDTVLRLMRLGFELGALFLLWMLTLGRKGKK